MFSKFREASEETRVYEAGLGAQAMLDASCEKRMAHDGSWVEERDLDAPRKFGGRWRMFITFFVGCCVVLGWLVTDCTSPRVTKEPEGHATTYQNLVKYAAATSSALPTPTGVLDVFQVYQPVLGPQGPVDETVSGSGQETTTTIDSASSSDSCEVLLMKYDFAYSYGLPFVGMYLGTLLAIGPLTDFRYRQLHSTEM